MNFVRPTVRRRAACPPRRRLAAVCWIGVCLLALAAKPATGATFTASLDRETISLGESVALRLAFEGASLSRRPDLPPIPGLRIEYAGPFQQTTVINGRARALMVYQYVVTPERTGTFTIPPIVVQDGARQLRSEPLNLRVEKASDLAQQAAGGQKAAFLRLVAGKNDVYVGEAFPVEIQLYVQQGRDLRMPQLRGEGFVFGAPSQSGRQTTQRIGAGTYQVLVFKAAARAVKAGQLTLGPAECQLSVAVGSRRRGIFDVFDPPMERVTLESPALPMTVSPLPEAGRPSHFNGAVGKFELRASASPTDVAVGDPITLRVQIQGTGAMDAVPYPAQDNWGQFKTYPPQRAFSPSDDLGLAGVAAFEQVVIPQSEDIDALPPLAFSFFDPDAEAYGTAESAPIPLTVRPTDAASDSDFPVLAGVDPSESPQASEMAHIKPRIGDLTAAAAPAPMRGWFYLVQLAPVLACGAAWAWKRQRDKVERDPKLRRRREVDARIRAGLEDLRRLASEHQTESFFATAFRLLQEQIGERLNLPAGAITESALDEQFAGAARPDLLRELHDLFQICNQARYSPHSSPQQLAGLVPRIESVLAALRTVDLDARPAG